MPWSTRSSFPSNADRVFAAIAAGEARAQLVERIFADAAARGLTLGGLPLDEEVRAAWLALAYEDAVPFNVEALKAAERCVLDDGGQLEEGLRTSTLNELARLIQSTRPR